MVIIDLKIIKVRNIINNKYILIKIDLILNKLAFYLI